MKLMLPDMLTVEHVLDKAKTVGASRCVVLLERGDGKFYIVSTSMNAAEMNFLLDRAKVAIIPQPTVQQRERVSEQYEMPAPRQQ